jgi:DNA topoisomerase I
MKLVIVESPAKCKKIESYLGPGYKCVASFGHITTIKNGLKDIDIQNGFIPTFSLLDNKSRSINLLKKEIGRCSEVILATDDDREGEAIAWHICNVFNLPLTSTKRIIFNEITKPALQYAIQNPKLVDLDKVGAQQARQILDLLVGFTISPILWKHITRKKRLSAGRCQTPALRIILDNDINIKNNPGKIVYNTNLLYKDIHFLLNKSFEDEKEVEDLLRKNLNFKHILAVKEGKQSKKKAPLPMTTSVLQQKASNELGFSPKRTMQTAQKLYEAGHITYMRTDSKKYSVKFITDCILFIKDKYGEKYASKDVMDLSNKKEAKGAKTKNAKGVKDKVKDDKNIQEAHEAIRPTHIETNILEDMDVGQMNLYKLIRNITLESCMIPAIYKNISGSINAPDDLIYKDNEEQVVEPGWKIVRGYQEENLLYSFLLSKIKKKVIIKYKSIQSHAHLKDKTCHLTEARLIQILETKGIGRPSTFSNIITKIQEREYVKKMDVLGKKITTTDFTLTKKITKKEITKDFGNEKNKLVLQPTGKIVIEFLIKHFDNLFIYDYTKNMEDQLDEVSKGKKKKEYVCSAIYSELNKLSKNINVNHREMYEIDDYHVYMIGKYGPVIKKEKDGKTTFISVKNGLDVEMIKNKKYSIKEMIQEKKENNILGTYLDSQVFLNKGKFGHYVNYNGKNYSIKHIKKDPSQIKLADVEDILNGKKVNNSILYELNNQLSIRKGKYGNYIFYKNEKMTKPKFLKLKKTWKQYSKKELLEWIVEEYNI